MLLNSVVLSSFLLAHSERRYVARFHKLPKAWSELMSRKNWATISEETLHQGAAALAFLRRYMEDNMGNRGVRISHGCLSKFAMERAIMCRLQGEEDSRHAEYVGAMEFGVHCFGRLAFTRMAILKDTIWTPKEKLSGCTSWTRRNGLCFLIQLCCTRRRSTWTSHRTFPYCASSLGKPLVEIL